MLQKRSLYFQTASLLGLGTARFAPGTVGTALGGIPCFLAVGYFSWIFQLCVSVLIFGLGWYVSEKTEQELRKTDPAAVVIDELCGFLIAMIGHPVTIVSILTGFAFFRLFDIWKPWPLKTFQEKLRGGLGIMMDDVGAGIYANIAGLIILRLVHH